MVDVYSCAYVLCAGDHFKTQQQEHFSLTKTNTQTAVNLQIEKSEYN